MFAIAICESILTEKKDVYGYLRGLNVSRNRDLDKIRRDKYSFDSTPYNKKIFCSFWFLVFDNLNKKNIFVKLNNSDLKERYYLSWYQMYIKYAIIQIL